MGRFAANDAVARLRLALRLWDSGCGMEEIAQELGCCLSNAQSLVLRALNDRPHCGATAEDIVAGLGCRVCTGCQSLRRVHRAAITRRQVLAVWEKQRGLTPGDSGKGLGVRA
jgi:predicted transcriptional regulator